MSSNPGCVDFSSVNTPSTTGYLNSIEALHGCLLLTDVRSNGPGNGFISHNIAPSKFTGTMMGQVSLFFEDPTAESLLDTAGSQFLTGQYPAPSTPISPPQGRLSCDSTLPVQVSDQNSCTTIYYLPYLGSSIPVSDGFAYSFYSFGASLTLALDGNSADTGYQQGGKVYDIFAGFKSHGLLALGTGPAWSSGTTRSASIVNVNGVWVNGTAITFRYNGISTGFTTCPAFACTYVGSMYATSDGHTKVQFSPTGSNGGTNNFMGLWNAYNRARAYAVSVDTTNNWGCTTNCDGITWQPLDQQGTGSGLKNRISVVDGLGLTSFDILLTQANSNLSSSLPTIGACIDSTSCAPINPAQITGTNTRASLPFNLSAYPQLGFHYVQAVQQTANTTGTNEYGTNATLRLSWEY